MCEVFRPETLNPVNEGRYERKKYILKTPKRIIHGAWISRGNLSFYFPTQPINADLRSLIANPRD